MSMIYQQTKVFKEEQAQGVNCLAFSPDGAHLASGHGRNLAVWSVNTGKTLHLINTSTRVLTLTWCSCFGRSVIICGTQDGQIISIWIKKVYSNRIIAVHITHSSF